MEKWLVRSGLTTLLVLVIIVAAIGAVAINCGRKESDTQVGFVRTRVETVEGRVGSLESQSVSPRVDGVEKRLAAVEGKVGSIEGAVSELRSLTKSQMVEAFRELYGRPSNLDEETKKLIQDIRKEGQEAWARELLAKTLEVPQKELAALNQRLSGVEKKLEATPTPAPTPAPAPTPRATAMPTQTPTSVPTATPTPTPAPIATPAPMQTPTATATLVPAPIVLPAPAATSTPEIPKETVFMLKLEAEKEGDKVLAILSNLRGKFEDPGCPKDSLIQPAETTSELRRCLTTKGRLMEWLNISTLPAAGREWLVLDQTIFPVTDMEEKPLKRQPAFWFQVRPSTETRLMVELEAGTVKLEGLAEPGGEKVVPNGRVLSKEGYLAWIQRWTKKEPPSHLKPGKYAVYPFLLER